MELPKIPATVKLSKNYLTFTVDDKKIKVVVTDSSIDLLEMDTKVGQYFADRMTAEYDKTAFLRKLKGEL